MYYRQNYGKGVDDRATEVEEERKIQTPAVQRTGGAADEKCRSDSSGGTTTGAMQRDCCCCCCCSCPVIQTEDGTALTAIRRPRPLLRERAIRAVEIISVWLLSEGGKTVMSHNVKWKYSPEPNTSIPIDPAKIM
jgi:hypothetical protein